MMLTVFSVIFWFSSVAMFQLSDPDWSYTSGFYTRRICILSPKPDQQHTTNRRIRYDTIEEFNVDSKVEYSAKSSTRSQKLKQTKPVHIYGCVQSCMTAPAGKPLALTRTSSPETTSGFVMVVDIQR